ncbi:IclR family transcriptional regulator [Halanaerobium saccharolyticum]|uniref:Glycerol operon regulatory protein n=1 Tax=Halanaerobium saccharolyticum TaxID=43595 RepID=A0A4R7Z768_9FIRM|nr:IclR family transcriptional regulator [Halanaerobium saccharolyticum]RAK12580.1 IclR family transcriptional regulator [Halanaerobium saccharolyticum]TDW06506.1 IclR family transcriptional regulator [Halanaerobium saccharolyticum]TDX61754.1 IclR family transcriptional regulator [Halanaerobium saccharolyticum]
MVKKKQTDNLVQSLLRAIDILNLVSQSKEGLNVTQISEALNLHKSTVYRLLNTLQYKNYVKKDKYKNYKTGKKIIELGNKALNDIDLRNEAKPYLMELGNITKETVHLGIIEDYEIVYIDKVESSHTIRMHSSIGKGNPLYCTGVGKALLAFSSDKYIEDFIKNNELKRFTPNTITEKSELRDHLKKIQKQGYAVDNMEHEDNIRCVATPIFDHKKNVIAAISISGPVQRITLEKVKEYAELAIEFSQKISRSLFI